MRDFRTEYSVLAERIDDQLAESCPDLSEESRRAFAAQIAVAQLRSADGRTARLHLHEMGGRSN
jgi:hypothetical protein